MITGLIEEADAINWYEQRISVEKNEDAKAIMINAQKEEFKHFSMDLEFLLRQKDDWRKIINAVISKPGDIVKNGEKAEKKVDLKKGKSCASFESASPVTLVRSPFL